MAKKKVLEESSEESGQENLPADLPFELKKWQDFPQWRCRLCPFDTLEGEDAYWLHFAQAHAPAPEPTPVRVIQIYDRFGNPVDPLPEE